MDVHKIASVLGSDANVVTNWKRIYNALELDVGELVTLTRRHDSEQITNYDLFLRILQSANGPGSAQPRVIGRRATDAPRCHSKQIGSRLPPKAPSPLQ